MRRKLLGTYCMFLTLVSFYFYLTKPEPNVDTKTTAVKTFFLAQKINIIYSFLFFFTLYGHFPFLIPCSSIVLHISVNINVSNDTQ